MQADSSIVNSQLSILNYESAVAGWREVFADPQLAALIQEGLSNNSNLRIAKLHIDAAKAELRHANWRDSSMSCRSPRRA
jgi:outer membrane protein TolC